MIKLSKHIYIHFTTILLFLVCWFNRKLELLTISYFIVLFHEAAHFITAILIGIEPSKLILFPFGVNLRLKSNIIYSISDEILLYLSGPLFNAIFALFIQNFCENSVYLNYIYWNNIALFVFNIIPIVPMDGGNLIKRILSDKIGSREANIIMKYISIIFIIILIIIEGYLLVNNYNNYYLLFAIIFLTANIFTDNSKYNISLIKELIYIKNKKTKKIEKSKCIVVKENYNRKKIAEFFNISTNYIIFEKDDKNKIVNILSEEEIIDSILR